MSACGGLAGRGRAPGVTPSGRDHGGREVGYPGPPRPHSPPTPSPARSGDGQEPAAAPHHQRLPEHRQRRATRHVPARRSATHVCRRALLSTGAGQLHHAQTPRADVIPERPFLSVRSRCGLLPSGGEPAPLSAQLARPAAFWGFPPDRQGDSGPLMGARYLLGAGSS